MASVDMHFSPTSIQGKVVKVTATNHPSTGWQVFNPITPNNQNDFYSKTCNSTSSNFEWSMKVATFQTVCIYTQQMIHQAHLNHTICYILYDHIFLLWHLDLLEIIQYLHLSNKQGNAKMLNKSWVVGVHNSVSHLWLGWLHFGMLLSFHSRKQNVIRDHIEY